MAIVNELYEISWKESRMTIFYSQTLKRALKRLKEKGIISKDAVFYDLCGLSEDAGRQLISENPKTLLDMERFLLISKCIKRLSPAIYQWVIRNVNQDDDIFVKGANTDD